MEFFKQLTRQNYSGVLFFDENVNQFESMITLGDSGSPLLIKNNGQFSVTGIASDKKESRKLKIEAMDLRQVLHLYNKIFNGLMKQIL